MRDAGSRRHYGPGACDAAHPYWARFIISDSQAALDGTLVAPSLPKVTSSPRTRAIPIEACESRTTSVAFDVVGSSIDGRAELLHAALQRPHVIMRGRELLTKEPPLAKATAIGDELEAIEMQPVNEELPLQGRSDDPALVVLAQVSR